MKFSGDWVDAPATQGILGMIEDAGYQALLVGGCVRNALIGAAISDIDIATDAVPETVSTLAENAGFKAVPTGVEHGTVTVVAGGIPYEVTTFRRDVETDGRRAVVSFSRDIAEDARRRDFTMNALYARRDGQIIDPLGGLPDLLARRVRFIEDAAQRIREDYLRILRFFRFHAWYGDDAAGLDADALAACAQFSDGLSNVSKERIGAEMCKLLAAPDPSLAVGAMEQTGVLAQVLPGAGTRALFPLVHLEDGDADAVRRLAAMGGDDVAERLRLSKKDARRLELLRAETGSTTPFFELAYRHDDLFAQDVALLRAAVFEMPLSTDLKTDIALGRDAKFPIVAADLELQGADLGAELRRLEQAWIDSRFQLSRNALLKDAKR